MIKLSKTEQQIMDYFWDSEQTDIMARDVLQHFYEKGKSWNQQNIANHLKNLQKLRMLRAEVRNGKYYYYPTMTRQEYRLMPTKEILNKDYNGSYGDLFCAMAHGSSSREEIEELRRILDDFQRRNGLDKKWLFKELL